MEWLNLAISLYSKISTSWTEWLKINIGIHGSYARKLRELSKYFRNYPRFQKLEISFNELYNCKKQIQTMVTNNNIHSIGKIQINVSCVMCPA